MKNEHRLYMEIASKCAEQSHCVRNRVGAVLVKDGNIIAFGYNGTPRGFDNACEIGNETKPEVLHAESNAIAKCARSTANSQGSILYVNVAPCFECAKLVIQAGIREVYYEHDYRLANGIELLKKAGVIITKLNL